MPVGRRDQGRGRQPFDGEVSTLVLRHAEQFGDKPIEAGRKATGLGIDKTGRECADGALAALGETGKALGELVESPAVEFIEAGQYCVFTFRLEALTLRFGARSGLRIGRLGAFWLRRERRLEGRRLFWRAV